MAGSVDEPVDGGQLIEKNRVSINTNQKQIITHVITGLNTGGAEMMLYRLLSTINREKFSSEVISLTTDGLLCDRIRELDIPVRSLGMRPGSPDPFAVLRLSNWLRQSKPVLVQTWMYHADLVGGLAAWLAGIPVVWNIRHSDLNPTHIKRSTLWVSRICAWLSHKIPVAVVVNSQNSKRIHAKIGYCHEKMVFIPNGFNLEQFFPDPQSGADLRRQLNLDEDHFLIGMAARYHPQKDHATFVRAAGILSTDFPNTRFLMCGEDITDDNQELVGMIKSEGLFNKIILLGLLDRMTPFFNALDILSTSSGSGESFPQVVGEAMACGIPCVVTDVGDSAFIIGDTGRVVPTEDPASLAAAWEEILRMTLEERVQLGRLARARVEENFSIEEVAGQYKTLYDGIISRGGKSN